MESQGRILTSLAAITWASDAGNPVAIRNTCCSVILRVKLHSGKKKKAERGVLKATPPIDTESFQIKTSICTTMAADFDEKQNTAVISKTKFRYQFSSPFQFRIRYGAECALSHTAFRKLHFHCSCFNFHLVYTGTPFCHLCSRCRFVLIHLVPPLKCLLSFVLSLLALETLSRFFSLLFYHTWALHAASTHWTRVSHIS
jgi:hypothetical protein